jgi:hypothetical protein
MARGDDEYDNAVVAARRKAAALPLILSARYDRRSRKVVIALSTGIDLAFRPDNVQGLGGAADDDLARIDVTPEALHWPALDADLLLEGLIVGKLGSAAWMAARAGRATSSAKASAARANGRKGGRPKKVA